METRTRHHLPIPAEAYWETLYCDRTFIEALYTEGLGGEKLVISAWEQAGKAYSRTLSFTPKMNAPAAMKRVLGGAFRCEERGAYDPERQAWSFQYISGSLASKITITGQQRTQAHPEGCEVTSTLSVNVKLLGVGRLIEKTIVAQFHADMDAQAAFIRRWLERR